MDDTAGDIVTTDEYDNFELELDYKVPHHANSGVMYRVSEDEPAPYFTGPEYQVLDNKRHPDGRSKLTSAASCYALYPPSEDATKPVGEWNQAKIVVSGGKVEHWLNGKKVVEYELGSDALKALIAGSKFKDMARFAREDDGFIALQHHDGGDVWFRNVRVRPYVGAAKGR